jgi:hypothetical protein
MSTQPIDPKTAGEDLSRTAAAAAVAPASTASSAAARGGSTKRSKADIEREKKAEEKRLAEAAEARKEQQRWSKAVPAIVTALAAKVRKVPAGPDSVLGKKLLERVEQDLPGGSAKQHDKLVPRGRSAEDLVRHLAFGLILADVDDSMHSDYMRDEVGKVAKGLGVDLKPLLAVDAEKEAAPKKAKRG